MDKLFIRDLKVETIIGAFDWEKKTTQTIILDLELAIDAKKAASQDKLTDALDYSTLTQKIKTFLEKNPCQLIETLAERVAQLLLNEFEIQWLRLQVRKPGAVAQAKEVGVVIERER